MVHRQSESTGIPLQVLPAIAPETLAEALLRTNLFRYGRESRSGESRDRQRALTTALKRRRWIQLHVERTASSHSDAFLRVTEFDGTNVRAVEMIDSGRPPSGQRNAFVSVRVPRNRTLRDVVAGILRGQTNTVYGLMDSSIRLRLADIDQMYDWQQFLDFTPGRGQDGLQEDFLHLARGWYAHGQVGLDRAFPVAYFTAGASQAMEKLLCPPFCRRLHVLEGEYEGAKEIAKANGLEVVFHDRRDYGRALRAAYESGDVFYVSAPSAIDGEYDPNLTDFIRQMGSRHPGVKFVVDITYVGLVQRLQPLQLAAHDNVEAIVCSLSKTFGIYYGRIGCVFLRTPRDGFGGLDWFKNTRSIVIGTELLIWMLDGTEARVMRYPLLQAADQRRAIAIHKACGLLPQDARPSNASLLALSDGPPPIGEVNGSPTVSVRGGVYRYCLSGTIWRLMREDERKDKEGT